MKKILKQNLGFGIIYLTFVMVFLFLILKYDKGELHLMLTSYHSPFLDKFFRIVTDFGGSSPVIIGVLFVLYRYGASI